MKEIKAAFELLARDHNDKIDYFTRVTLFEHFGSNKIKPEQWFEAQALIKEQNFWEKGLAIVEAARAQGLDFKINAQSNEIIF